jgi:adenine-specific DNA-methyltransferase
MSEEIDRLRNNKKYGLIFEEHIPECTLLYEIPIKRGSIVSLKTGKINQIYTVKKITGDSCICIDKS